MLTKRTQKKYGFISIVGASLGVLIYYYINNSNTSSSKELAPFYEVFLAGLCGVLIAYITYVLTLLLDRFLPWKHQIANRLLLGIIIHFLSSFALVISLFYIYHSFVLKENNILSLYSQMVIKLMIILLSITVIYTVVYFALFSYYTYARLQIETVRQERKQIDLQLNALKSQLSPHFLFNSLNAISSLSFKSISKAELFIRRLANIYQYTLDSYHIKLITLEEELKMATSYQYLLQTRFKNKFICIMDVPSKFMNSKIPPLTLQMLIENAVKHNQLSEDKLLKVTIDTDGNYIRIHNNITNAPKKITSFNIGLKNISARYLLLTNRTVIIKIEDGFMVKIPIIK